MSLPKKIESYEVILKEVYDSAIRYCQLRYEAEHTKVSIVENGEIELEITHWLKRWPDQECHTVSMSDLFASDEWILALRANDIRIADVSLKYKSK